MFWRTKIWQRGTFFCEECGEKYRSQIEADECKCTLSLMCPFCGKVFPYEDECNCDASQVAEEEIRRIASQLKVPGGVRKDLIYVDLYKSNS